jgi:hypothetical protein
MKTKTAIGVRIYETDASDRHRLIPHHEICRGQSPAEGTPWPHDSAPPMDFHLALAGNNELLILFRAGKLPQVIRINELVSDWLDAARDPQP